jgi:hypothetical protein
MSNLADWFVTYSKMTEFYAITRPFSTCEHWTGRNNFQSYFEVNRKFKYAFAFLFFTNSSHFSNYVKLRDWFVTSCKRTELYGIIRDVSSCEHRTGRQCVQSFTRYFHTRKTLYITHTCEIFSRVIQQVVHTCNRYRKLPLCMIDPMISTMYLHNEYVFHKLSK